MKITTMKLSKKKIIIISIIAIILAVFFVPRIVNPFRRSEESIEKYLLKKIPLGTNINETEKILEDITGYADLRSRIVSISGADICLDISNYNLEFKNYKKISNEKSCNNEFFNKNLIQMIYLEGYFNFLPLVTKYGNYINMYFIFDENEKLIDIDMYINKKTIN